MIKGFLHREGRKVVNGVGEEILLKGMGTWKLASSGRIYVAYF